MEHHASEEDFIDCFRQLIHNTRDKVFFCADDPISLRICSDHPKCEAFSYPTDRIPLSLPGRYNQWNAAAALAVCKRFKTEEEILPVLENLRPIRRRFETVFEEEGILIISDYAHHPTEIAALFQRRRFCCRDFTRRW